jgi:hypothetical protein
MNKEYLKSYLEKKRLEAHTDIIPIYVDIDHTLVFWNDFGFNTG